MSKAKVFVIGASGNVGKATVNALAANYGEKLDIKAGVRKPEQVPNFQSLQGVTVVRAEMGKRDELIKIFKDVDVLFLVVPGAPTRVELTKVTAEAARDAGVKHILSIGSSSGSDTILGAQMRVIEGIISNFDPNYTILRLPWFMDNYFAFKESIQKFSAIYDAIDPIKRFPTICMDDLGLAAAVIMSSPEKHAGKVYSLVSDRHSFNDIVKAFNEVLGKEIKYTQQSYEEARKVWLGMGVSELQVNGLIEYWKQVNAGITVQPGDDDDFTAITGKQPTNVSTWVRKYGNAFK